ncbi:MAG: DUF3604 domain-containing protein [Deltaproteobacteria bacterium]
MNLEVLAPGVLGGEGLVMLRILLAAVWIFSVSPALAVEVNFSPYASDEFPNQVFWGDTHVHSSFSMDANAMGNTRLTPADAYAFAKGGAVTSNSGARAKLQVPLDFLVVSDHAEYMGILPKIRAGDAELMKDPAAQKIAAGLSADDPDVVRATMGDLIGSLAKNTPIIDNQGSKRSIWSEITRMADAANDPGTFTALIGYEWTSMPGGDNLHRVVIYKDDAAKASQLIPLSAFDGERPEDLWAFMGKYESLTGGQILAIPHNGNVSNGRMFAVENSAGEKIDAAYAAERAAREPLVEVTQIKGDAEVHPLLAPDDEFADFETWDQGNLSVTGTTPKKPGMLAHEYARSALKLGLELEAETGINPFKFGMIGSTDAHTSLATGAEANFWGKAVMFEPGGLAERVDGPFLPSAVDPKFDITAWQQVASGYAAVWARENTRAALFDAMMRKEVYATTGPRMVVRFFGGWDYQPEDAVRPDTARIGYAKGVPMGGDLPQKAGEAPVFVVTAARDPHGANLDRVQIIKGWRSAEGELMEKVYNVAASDDRLGADGKVATIESTIDFEQVTWTNTVGDAVLTAFWRDPDFDPAESAFYYVRVLEIPKPRWTVYDEKRLGAKVPAEAPRQVQDRAYTSPIWYTPDA